MRTRDQIVEALINAGVIAIVRTKSAEAVEDIVRALMAGGLNAIEITMTVPGAREIIRATRKRFGENILLGAGTVLDGATCQGVIAAGAEYIVTPVLRTELVSVAHKNNKPIAMGAFTPTEAQTAYEAGADFVKIFPADGLGPQYIRNLRGPLPHLRIIPTGGVTPGNVGEWIRAGAAAVGVGSALLSPKILEDKNWKQLTRVAREMVDACKNARTVPGKKSK